MPIYGPGSPGYVPSPFDTARPQFTGDAVVTGGTNIITDAHVTGNNAKSTFISANVPCAASVQTLITSITLAPGVWNIDATVSASVNSAIANGDQEIAIVPHGGAASVAYAATTLNDDLHGTEAGAAINATVTLPAQTQIDLVGWSSLNAPFTALASSLSGGYANATGISATPTV